MSATSPNIRESLDNASPENMADLHRELAYGDLLSMMVLALAPTEAAAAVVLNVATLAAMPGVLLDVVATVGVSLGRKVLRRGPISGPAALSPAPGEVIWDGGKKVLFNAADAVTAASMLYTLASGVVTPSYMQRSPGQQD